jgi:hypothetical protein
VPIVTEQQMVSVRDIYGNTVTEFVPSQLGGLQWGRQVNQVSQCSVTTPPLLDGDGNLLPIVPWLHWVDVWSTDMNPVMYWSGPIQKPATDQFAGQITAVDHAAYLSRTRCPLSQSWDAIDPSIPAASCWQQMLYQQGINGVTPVQRNNPWGQRFDITLTSDIETLDQTMQELEQMGLNWSVSANVPLVGIMPLEPIASLGQNDFLARGLQVTIDGTNVYNDVLMRGPDNIVETSVPLNGLNLQTIVNVNNMFELSNVEAAAQQYVLYTGSFRKTILAPGNAPLNNDSANISIDQLIPTARYSVEAFGVQVRMQLTSMQCTVASGVPTQIGVTLVEVPNWTEIGKLNASGGNLSMQPNAAAQTGTGQSPSSSAVGSQQVTV